MRRRGTPVDRPGTVARFVGWAALCLCLVACDGGPRPADWLAQATEANRAADAALARSDRDAARDALGRFVALPVPDGLAADDRRVVVQDVLFRLALVEIEATQPAAALRWIERGLGEGRGEDVFTANLLVARGRVYEMLGHERGAIDDYGAALRINERLLDAALPTSSGSEEGDG